MAAKRPHGPRCGARFRGPGVGRQHGDAAVVRIAPRIRRGQPGGDWAEAQTRGVVERGEESGIEIAGELSAGTGTNRTNQHQQHLPRKAAPPAGRAARAADRHGWYRAGCANRVGQRSKSRHGDGRQRIRRQLVHHRTAGCCGHHQRRSGGNPGPTNMRPGPPRQRREIAVNVWRTRDTRSFCHIVMEHEILMQLRNQRKVRGEVSLYDPIGMDREGNEISLIDVLGSESDLVPDAVTTKMQVAALDGYLKSLDPKEQWVVRQRFGLGAATRLTQREIAKSLGISRSYVSRIEKRAVTKLLQEIDPDQRK